MAGFVLVVAAAVVCAARAAPPAARLYQPSAQLQQTNPLDYYLDHPELHNYYSEQQQQQKAGDVKQGARLESLEPDSEVELLPGAPPPQQPPHQPPQNIPGLIPGQRVFIIHMPIPGPRPGTIGGYQPVYIVAAGPQGNPAGYPGNGFHNAVILNPGAQAPGYPGMAPVYPGAAGAGTGYPGLAASGASAGYPGGGAGYPGLMPGTQLVFGAQQLSRPFELVYQNPAVAYQRAVAAAQQGPGGVGPGRLPQLVSLQTQPAEPEQNSNTQASDASPEPKQKSQASTESKEARNLRTTSAHAQARPQA